MTIRKICFVIATLMISALSDLRALDLTAFVKETQLVDSSNGKMTMIWWTPKSYWKASLEDSNNLTEDAKEKLASLFDKRVVVVIARMDVSLTGTFTRTNEVVDEDTIVCSHNGTRLKRVGSSDLDEETLSLFAGIKPILARSLGQMGSGLEFYTFENPFFAKGILIEDTDGRLEVIAFGKKARFRLPLSARLAPKVDPETGDSFPGNYKFNPYTGARL